MASGTTGSDVTPLPPAQENPPGPHRNMPRNDPVPAVRTPDILGEFYNISRPQMGYALIINNKIFRQEEFSDRIGADQDTAKIYQALDRLGFDIIEVLNDVTRNEILEKFDEVKRMDHSENDCFLCVFMSHGDKAGVWATDEIVEIKELTKYLSPSECPSLTSKPKIFITQACRGTDEDVGVGVILQDDDTMDRTVSDAGLSDDVEPGTGLPIQPLVNIVTIPNNMDFLMIYSSVNDHRSYRDTEAGSIFIQTLCDELEKLKPEGEEITSLLHRVNKRVAIEFSADNQQKQMPCYVSMLTKAFVLKKKDL